MLRLFSRAVPRHHFSASVGEVAILKRNLSEGPNDSHDDFMPKVKPPSGNSAGNMDAMTVIKKQITENPIMLYMKVSGVTHLCEAIFHG